MKSKMNKMIFMLVIILSILCSFAVVQAASLKWSSDYKILDNTTVYYHSGESSGVGSAGVFIGTLGEIKKSNKKMLGVGGFNFNADAEGRLIFGVVPVTAFDDMLQIGVAINPAEFRVNNSDSYMFSLGISISEVIDKLSGK